MRFVEIYDTTLRDGAQAEDISFLLEDKLRITEKLDELGIPFIEGGWPGANPKDIDYFKEVKKLSLKNATVVAFGSTRKAGNPVSKDPNLHELIKAGTSTITIFGKSWNLHVEAALNISLKKNLELIYDSVAYLVSKKKRVFYDAEHFFDGYKANPDYAIQTLKKAEEAGTECIILCDTNGGTMPWEVKEIFRAVDREIKIPLGIHTHNDSETAVANALVAVELGATQVQGTINGFGERCGNANLCSLIPNLKLKMKVGCLSDEQMTHLMEVSRFVSEIANLPHYKRQAYVGESAFAHKGGIHVHAIRKKAETYEHVLPQLVGNQQRILISDYSGKSNLLHKAEDYGIRLADKSQALHDLLQNLKELENQGYQFEGAEASFELLMRKTVGKHKRFFDLIKFRVIVEKQMETGETVSEATIELQVGKEVEHTAALGNGPVNALDNGLRKALEKFYPALKHVKLLDYKVRVLSASGGTRSKVRVLIESGDEHRKWGTVGVSENIIEASWQALVDSIEYKLLKSGATGFAGAKASKASERGKLRPALPVKGAT
ncbi:MAG: citramalate synthase [Nitrospirae bacterium]|nr:citramalate synthase [Nitrospirota bacterium]MBI3351032.1 citramalate synthase [Nitrospirota bacterium]